MRYLPVSEPLLDGNEKKYLNEAIDTGWISSEGPFVKKFETDFAHKVGRKYGIAVTNGTGALEIAVMALGIEPGDEVIVPTFTIISCAQAITKVGATVVPIDCDMQDYNILADEIEKQITPKTKAIMIVHIYGLASNVEPILSLAEKYGLKIIEDSAEAHGLTYKGKPCGSFGDISVFSFYANKTVTTGEGGMILTDSEELAAKCSSLRNLCFKPEKRFVHDEIGFNYRMTNLQAALGVAQLERLDEFIIKKKRIGEKYTELLNSSPYLQLPLDNNGYSENVYWVYPILLSDNAKVSRDEAMTELQKRGIGTRPMFYPLHLQPILLRLGLVKNAQNLINSQKIYERGFYIPSGLPLTDEELEYISRQLTEVITK